MSAASVELFWLPLGAGGHSVRVNGRIYEAVKARIERRAALDLYHSALRIRIDGEFYVLEQTPVPNGKRAERGVVAEGAVGMRALGRFRPFRYEIRLWRGGSIPDVAEAVDSPRALSDDRDVAERALTAIPGVPRFVWGRDQLGAGEMWNSNSVVAWVVVKGGLDAHAIEPPPGGAAPGWGAGIMAAGKD